MVTLNHRNLLRFNAVPTEVQMKLGISQVLSLPFAYNAPVIVLDFEVGNKNVIKGRFKDASRPRVFEFEIGDSVSFKPFTWKRTDSDVDPMAWEDFSKGYTYRYDAVKKVRKEKPKCGNTSYNCGKACISLKKNCKSDPPDKPSQEKVDKLRAAAGEFKAVQDDPTKKQEDNKLTSKPPKFKEVAPATSPDKTEVPITDLVKQPPVALKVGKKSVNLTDDLDSYRDLKLTADPVLGWQVINKNGDVLREPPNGNMAPSHRFKKREQAEKFANTVMARVEKLQKAQLKKEAVTATQKAKDVKKTTSKTRLVSQPQGDLKPEATQSQKAIKVQEVRSQEQESPLVPKEEIVKDAPKLIGDGTHEGVPKNAEEYREMMINNGSEITKRDSEQVIDSVVLWGRSSYSIRQKQQKGEFSQDADNIDTFIKNSTPYDGDIHRGLFFENREKALQWVKGDESGVLDNQSAHASWTSELGVAKEFAQIHGSYSGNKDQQPVIVSAKNKTGAPMKPLAKFPGENEVIVSKDARHKVKSVTEKNGVIYVETEEI